MPGVMLDSQYSGEFFCTFVPKIKLSTRSGGVIRPSIRLALPHLLMHQSRFFQALCPALAALMACSSCIREEALNAECDIIAVDSLWVGQHKDILIGQPIVKNESVSFTIKKKTDRSAFAPRFELTPGASLTAVVDGDTVTANGITRDFTTPRIYTTHSQDGNWSKDYSVSFVYPSPLRRLSFEHYELDGSGRYQEWYEVDAADTDNPRRDYWASGNSGYALTGMGATPSSYPTTADPSGYKGNCVKLTTCSTGSYGEKVNMPIAAGNLFVGQFNAAQAMLFPRKATKFGLQLVGGKPLRFEGYYKYAAGPVYTDRNRVEHPELKDTADIYAVIYEVDPGKVVPLNGDDVLSSDRIVLMARIDDPGEPSEWTRFSEPFRPMNGKSFDEERLRDEGYAIAIVATSSRQGAYFEGAIGSTLYIDELYIAWEGVEDDPGAIQ